MPRSLTIVAALALLLAGCTDPERRDGGEPKPLAVPVLEQAWEVPLADPEVDHAWAYDGALGVVTGRRVAAYDGTTGAERWHFDLPGEACASATTPNEAGLTAVLLRRPSGRCATVAVLDLRRGRVLWHKDVLPLHDSDYDGAEYDGVALSERTVVVTDSILGSGVRLRARTGRVAQLIHANHVGSDGHHLVIGERDFTTVVDVDTGRPVSSVPTDHEVFDLVPISQDPILLDTPRTNAHQVYRLDGSRLRQVGRGSGHWNAVLDGHLVVEHDSVLLAHDLATGEQTAATAIDTSKTVMGVRDGRLLTRADDPDWTEDGASAVRSIDPFDPEGAQVLGTFEGGPFQALVGDMLVTTGRAGLSAYQLPGTGLASADVLASLPWKAGDLLPTDVVDACLAVAGMGAPTGGCRWFAPQAERVDVTVEAVQPTTDESAAERATALLELEHHSEATETEGIGEEAWAYSDGGALSTSQVLARHRNVLVRVRVLDAASAASARRLAEQAARDVIAELESRG